jgi:ferric-dicitrate binding protein FerR (iron transport regulator)
MSDNNNENKRIFREVALRIANKPPDVEAQLAAVKQGRIRQPKRNPFNRWKIIAIASSAAAAVLVFMLLINPQQQTTRQSAVYIVADNGKIITPESPDNQNNFSFNKRENKLEYQDAQSSIPQETQIQWHWLVVPAGERYAVKFSDGTTVTINSNTTLRYPTSFPAEGERVVELNGEAYFEVAHDSLRPFIVQSAQAYTRVLGTQFNIRARQQLLTEITLVEGSVAVKLPTESWDNAVQLSPNERCTVQNGEMTVQQVDVMKYTAWRDGYSYYDNQTVREILDDIAAQHSMSVICSDQPVLSRRIRFWAESTEPVDDVLKRLGELVDMQITTNGNKIVAK